MWFLYTVKCKHERPVQEQNSKLIMPYLAKCSLPMWNSDPYILLKGLYLKANYFSPLASSFLWKLSRQFWGPWQDQDETVLLFPLISPNVLRSFPSSGVSYLMVLTAICWGSILCNGLILLFSKCIWLKGLLWGQLSCWWKWAQVETHWVSPRWQMAPLSHLCSLRSQKSSSKARDSGKAILPWIVSVRVRIHSS